VGDKEVEADSVSVRHRQRGDLGPRRVADLAAHIARLTSERAILEEGPPDAAAGGVS
jgi:threonyl-tRNA synthetase